MSKHKTVRVECGDLEADIDVEIAPLIEELWKADIDTFNSCQENRPGIAWIEFMFPRDAERFLNIVSGPYSDELDSLYNRIRLEWGPDKDTLKDAWEYSLYPLDLSVKQTIIDGAVDEEISGPPNFTFSVSIEFPRTDLPVLIERMQEFNQQQRKPSLATQRV